MAQVHFTSHLERQVGASLTEAAGSTLREVLEAVFAQHPRLRSYLLDDQERLRRHVVVFLDGRQIRDRATLLDPVKESSEIYVMQALSGGRRSEGQPVR